MAKTFEDRVEEVLGALHGMAWPLLEEADKRKIVGKLTSQDNPVSLKLTQ